jgi:hypothetical protein
LICQYYKRNIEISALPDTVEIAVSIGRTVIIDYNVDTFHIDSSSENISGHQNPLFERFESSIAIDTVSDLARNKISRL